MIITYLHISFSSLNIIIIMNTNIIISVNFSITLSNATVTSALFYFPSQKQPPVDMASQVREGQVRSGQVRKGMVRERKFGWPPGCPQVIHTHTHTHTHTHSSETVIRN